MSTATAEKLQDLLQDFRVAMMVTRTQDGQLRSRPMALAEVEERGNLWFLTDRHAGKLEEIAYDNRINVTLQSSSKFVSISGPARPVEDRTKIKALWQEAWKVWFPGGPDDPNLVLIEVQGETGEYWDNSGFSGLKYLFEAGKAYFSGTRPDLRDDEKIHGKVKL